MMAELAPLWGKFGHPSGQLSLPIIKRWNCKGPRKCNDINLTYGLSELVLRNAN